MKVKCIEDKNPYGTPQMPWRIEKGKTYKVKRNVKHPWGLHYVLTFQANAAYPAELFEVLAETKRSIWQRLFKR